MEVTNGFGKGIVKDVGELLRDSQSYEDALDIRLNSNDSASDHIVVNVKGNKLSFEIPTVPYTLSVSDPGNFTNTWSYAPQLLFSNGSVSPSGNTITGTGDINDFFDALVIELTTNPVFSQYDLSIHRIGSRVRIWSTTSEITGLAGLTLNLSQSSVPSITGQQIIGWTTINDDIYVYTTADTSTTGGTGTIWKVTYDDISLNTTIELVYSEELNFTTQYPIANPGGIESVYETIDVQRIYWTDRHNDLRSINITDPNVMALSPESLSLNVSVELKKPVLFEISDSGQLLTGHYQVAYALRTEGGGITPYSSTSNSIYIAEESLSGAYRSYTGNDSGVVTSKSFTVRIQDVDTSFSFMDIIVLRKETESSTAIISKVAEIPISSSTVTYTHTGTEVASIINENAFNRINNVFDRCHTIAQKDNILFAANTEKDPFDIQFDSRAYRWDANQNLILNDAGGNSTPYTTSEALDPNFTFIGEEDDAINPDQKTYRYMSDGITLGGEGPNIEYVFTTESLNTDVRARNDYAHPWRLPWDSTQGTIDLGNGIVHEKGNDYNDMKSPFKQHVFKGYRRGETYRFAWVPFKDGVDGHAQWIADIRFPDVFEQYVSGDPWFGQGDTFPLLYPNFNFTDPIWATNQLGIIFNVTIPQSVADKIDGYHIKRVKLEPEDRSVVANGILHLSRKSTGSPTYYTPITDNTSSTSTFRYGCNDLSADTFDTTTNRFHRIVSFHSPDFLFGKPINHRSGDKIEIVSGVSEEAIQTNLSDPTGTFALARHGWYKLYNESPIGNLPALSGDTVYDVLDGSNVGLGQEVNIDGEVYKNRALENSGSIFSFGTDTVTLALDRGLPQLVVPQVLTTTIGFTNTGFGYNYTNSASINDIADKVYAKYTRDNVASQYGGQSFEARSKNIYIHTGTSVHLNGQLNHIVRVFGGDTYVNVFDTLKVVRNFAFTGVDSDRTRASGFYFPCESAVNTDMREGFTCNTDLGPSGIYPGNGTAPPDLHPLDYGEDFKYNYLFSQQMDTQRSFPKPINTSEITEHPVRIWASASKVYGELSDSWRMFNSQTFIDIQGDLGEIRQLINNNERLLAWQKRGFGVASVNERAVINDNSGNGIVLGQSGILPRFDYLSKSIGSWHQFGFINGLDNVMFFDMKDGGIYSYSNRGLKDITEGKLKGWLYKNTRGNILLNDSPIAGSPFNSGLCCTYDRRNKEYILSFHDTISDNGQTINNDFTLVYDERYDRFVSYRSFKPYLYINDGEYVFSPDPDDPVKIYMHDIGNRGEFYGNDPSTSYVLITVNPNPNVSKVNDNIRWYSEVYDANGNEISTETIDGVTVSNPYQTTGVRTDIRRLLREWKFTVLYEQNTKNRIRGHYAREKFDFLNNNNKEFKLYYITNNYRVFPK